MHSNLTKSQVDRLGERLKTGQLTEPDLKLLDEYRRSFNDAYEIVIRSIREKLQLEPTGRFAKSTSSIVEKLQREHIRLTQIQDIAGCRIIVADIAAQEVVIASLRSIFAAIHIVDRRKAPSHGYRAVHAIIKVTDKPVEIQIRSSLQQLWAEFSEKLSDVIDPKIKYGGGDEVIRSQLDEFSNLVNNLEDLESQLLEIRTKKKPWDGEGQGAFDDLQGNIEKLRRKIAVRISVYISMLEKIRKREE